MKIYQLTPDEDGWALTMEGTEKPLASFDSKKVALSAARDLADQRKGRLIVYRDDGTIEELREPPALF